MSERPSFNLFSQILDLVEERCGNDLGFDLLVPLLSAIQQQPFPAPGHRIELQVFTATAGADGEVSDEEAGEVTQMCLYRPSGNDYILDYISFSLLFSRVRVEVILQLFDCLMGERRIILVADDLATLSGCATAACAMLNPFCWQHVFIPVLPSSLLDYCCAPMPFFTGVTSSCMEQVKRLPMEEVYMLNLSTGEWELYPDLPMVLPPGLAASLARSLAEIAHYSTSGGVASKRFDVSVARRFKYFVFGLLGSYAEFTTAEGFRRQDFLRAVEDPVHRAFAVAFTETQMFEQFIAERVQMRRNGNLASCTLLKVARQSRASMRIDPTELSFCSKCEKPLEANFETVHGKPLCAKCAERKKRLTWKGFITDSSSRWGAGWLFKKTDSEDAAAGPSSALGSLGRPRPEQQAGPSGHGPPSHPAPLPPGQQQQRPPAADPLEPLAAHKQQLAGMKVQLAGLQQQLAGMKGQLPEQQPPPQPPRLQQEQVQVVTPQVEEVVVHEATVVDATALRVCHAQTSRKVQVARAMPPGAAVLQTSKLTQPPSRAAAMLVRPRGATHAADGTSTAQALAPRPRLPPDASLARPASDSEPARANAARLAQGALDVGRRHGQTKVTTTASVPVPSVAKGGAVPPQPFRSAPRKPSRADAPFPSKAERPELPFRKPLPESLEAPEPGRQRAPSDGAMKGAPFRPRAATATAVVSTGAAEGRPPPKSPLSPSGRGRRHPLGGRQETGGGAGGGSGG
eukprot:CAMPEP_0114619814 /NCGR_PEP_ID=MMETSP0168-20121206/8402_1 /TAXON_ID=95228 ORGANISM="Vannella sp., Strain DIVA3 517/6/12" /NCGR_SAMPLE_ID=MMETSP0168 /ASSEMBLY_ACC=CAM_ASM_000044 /LENGTH=741 /DNA_ID=CAMNT_0001830983 /DNA_START=99 /DNA_END=2320 /DNA_ORIENTATION=+